MRFTNLLFCANLLSSGVIVMCEHMYPAYFEFTLSKRGLSGWPLSAEYFFEEGLEYTVVCRRRHDWDLHWEVEPFGLKSSISKSIFYTNRIVMVFTLHRDEQISIGCYSKNINNSTEDRSTTFSWDKKERHIPAHTQLLQYATNDAEHKCYEKTQQCAYFNDISVKKIFDIVELKIYTRMNHDDNQHVKHVWVPAVSGVVVAVLLAICFICYIMIIRKRIQNEHIYAEPSPVYAELNMDSDAHLTSKEKAPLATKIRCIYKKKVPNIKNLSENTRSKIENIQIEEHLYSEIQ